MTISPAISWPTFLAPTWGWLGLIAIPIILLYILRQKRPDTPVSSTILWSKALSDMRASTPWQKLRKNLQLLLQLLILAAIVLTLMRPVIESQATNTLASVIVIDATASMQTMDGIDFEPNTPPISRFEKACEEARKLVDTMRPKDKMNIIVDGGGLTRTSSGFSQSKDDLLTFIKGLKATDCSSNLTESLLLAQTSLRAIGASAETGGFRTEATQAGKIYLLSDGSGVELPPMIKDSGLQFIQIGTRSNNVGITRMAVTPGRTITKGDKKIKTYQIFTEVFCADTVAHEIRVELATGTNTHFVAARGTNIAARNYQSVTFEDVEAEPGEFWITLTDKNNKDELAIDNVAYGMIPSARKIRVVLVGNPGTYLDRRLEQFLKAPSHAEYVDTNIVSIENFKPQIIGDLFVFNNVVPTNGLPVGDMLFIRPPGSVAEFTVSGGLNNPQVLRSMRDAPELLSMEVAELRIYKALNIMRDAAAEELVSTTNGPLIAYRDVGMSRRYIVAFSPTPPDSDWIQYSSFPIFLENVLEGTRQRHFIGVPQIVPAGGTAKIEDIAANATVEMPGDKGTKPLLRNSKGTDAEFAETDKIGFYKVHSDNKTGVFAVNLLSQPESDILAKPLNIPGVGNVEGARSVAQINREIWPWIAAVGLLLLLVEWIVYHWRVA